MKNITVYSTPTCPKCEQLKDMLKKNNIKFNEIDMSTAEGLTELRINGVFSITAPILQIDKKTLEHDELFKESGTLKKIINEIT